MINRCSLYFKEIAFGFTETPNRSQSVNTLKTLATCQIVSQLNQVVLSCVCFLMLVSNLRTSLMAMVA